MSSDSRRLVDGLELRLAGPQDAALFDHMDDEIFDHPVAYAHLQAYLAAPGHLMAIARVVADGMTPGRGPAGLLVGQARAMVHHHPDGAPQLYVDNLGVAPHWRRRGVASRLLAILAAAGRARGCQEWWVATEPDNRAACALYLSLGLRQTRAAV
ncbi:MAG: GNAT family N-acetyltransferase, partial [Alphaproteobacteria bacterium]